MQASELRADEITKTLRRLVERIESRFPGSGLADLGRELTAFSNETQSVMDWVVRPIWWLRVSLGAFILLAVVGVIYTVTRLPLGDSTLDLGNLIQALEATTSELIIITGGLFFLVSIETRVKRARVVDALNKLRAVAHIVDMKQLTKDPDNPKRDLDDLQLGRYLDYCSELLALISKIGFLYVTRFDDPEANQSVNELETLTTGLSRKIWQKISILHQRRIFEPEAPSAPEAALETASGD